MKQQFRWIFTKKQMTIPTPLLFYCWRKICVALLYRDLFLPWTERKCLFPDGSELHPYFCASFSFWCFLCEKVSKFFTWRVDSTCHSCFVKDSAVFHHTTWFIEEVSEGAVVCSISAEVWYRWTLCDGIHPGVTHASYDYHHLCICCF